MHKQPFTNTSEIVPNLILVPKEVAKEILQNLSSNSEVWALTAFPYQTWHVVATESADREVKHAMPQLHAGYTDRQTLSSLPSVASSTSLAESMSVTLCRVSDKAGVPGGE